MEQPDGNNPYWYRVSRNEDVRIRIKPLETAPLVTAPTEEPSFERLPRTELEPEFKFRPAALDGEEVILTFIFDFSPDPDNERPDARYDISVYAYPPSPEKTYSIPPVLQSDTVHEFDLTIEVA